MKDAHPRAIYLKDYEEPDYWITKTELIFDLHGDYTQVEATLHISRASQASSDSSPLVLHGQELELRSVSIDGVVLDTDAYSSDSESLTIKEVPAQFALTCITVIKPHENTSLEGLYKSRTMFCTQCEAEGFRKITYYLDRPDVMSEFTTKIIADKTLFPILLSNGNLVDSGTLDNERHFAVWHDPFKKPCYLFALVAGSLSCVEDSFTTISGRNIAIKLYVEEKDLDKCEHAINSLKNAMSWDEKVYGREYDLDIFMIVAVDDFNMGAMENKGLNIFNTSCVLAKPETTTDAGFQRVEAVVAHEYFHNWSGNRVTCRDWFQLSLKEGFTVFRDQEFSADMGSPTVKRVEDVTLLRTMQFAEDAGPMAHPVQPDSFIEISNFYTLTIYEKGAEIVRMIYNLLGPALFREGSDHYFENNDGKAVTIDDFVASMALVSDRDFSQFMHWYKYAGTPSVSVKDEYDEAQQQYTLEFSQSLPADKNAPALHIPIAFGLLGDAGALPLKTENGAVLVSEEDNTRGVIELTEKQQRFTFLNVAEKPVPSLLRGFSAPIKLKYHYSRDAYLTLMGGDDDGFCRWDASQNFATQVIQEVMAALVNEPAPQVDERLITAYRNLLADDSLDPAMVALMLTLPSEAYLAEQVSVVDVEGIHFARNRVQRKIAHALYDDFVSLYTRLHSTEGYAIGAKDIAQRSLKNTALHYMMIKGSDEAVSFCQNQLENATNMTDELAALTFIVHSAKGNLADLKRKVINDFYDKWSAEALVVNHWFTVQASAPLPETLNEVKSLMEHKAFDIRNPNKLRAVIGAFAMRNPVGFHHKRGDGYVFLADQVIYLNSTNPQIAARLISPLSKWSRYDEGRQVLMKAQLERIKQLPDLSKDVYEVVTKSLG